MTVDTIIIIIIAVFQVCIQNFKSELHNGIAYGFLADRKPA